MRGDFTSAFILAYKTIACTTEDISKIFNGMVSYSLLYFHSDDQFGSSTFRYIPSQGQEGALNLYRSSALIRDLWHLVEGALLIPGVTRSPPSPASIDVEPAL